MGAAVSVGDVTETTAWAVDETCLFERTCMSMCVSVSVGVGVCVGGCVPATNPKP